MLVEVSYIMQCRGSILTYVPIPCASAKSGTKFPQVPHHFYCALSMFRLSATSHLGWLTRTLNEDGIGIGGAVESGMLSADKCIGSEWLTAKAYKCFQSKLYPLAGWWAGIDGHR